jgi:hypothetical protein
MQTKTDYIEGTSLQLDLWGDQIARLEEELARSRVKGRTALEHKLELLKRRKRALKRRLRQAAHGADAARWNDVRGPLEDAVDDFRSLAGEVYDRVRTC